MFDLDVLLQTIAPPTRKPAYPEEIPSSTPLEHAGSKPASYPQAPASTRNLPPPPTPLRVGLRVMRVDAGNEPASGNSGLDEENNNLAGLRVNGHNVPATTEPPPPRELTRNPDPSGCPTFWQKVPELPPKGGRVRMVDSEGYDCLYRFKVGSQWYLLKFLPPFDGAVSVTDTRGRVRVLASIEEAAALLGVLHRSG